MDKFFCNPRDDRQTPPKMKLFWHPPHGEPLPPEKLKYPDLALIFAVFQRLDQKFPPGLSTNSFDGLQASRLNNRLKA